jgi:hypothetical protein
MIFTVLHHFVHELATNEERLPTGTGTAADSRSFLVMYVGVLLLIKYRTYIVRCLVSGFRGCENSL